MEKENKKGKSICKEETKGATQKKKVTDLMYERLFKT